MLLLDHLLPAELRGDIKHDIDENRITFILRGGLSININAISPDPGGMNVDDYSCLPLKTPHSGERQFTLLRSNREESTFGFIFPIASLVTGAELRNIFERRYAWAAIWHLLFKGTANEY